MSILTHLGAGHFLTGVKQCTFQRLISNGIAHKNGFDWFSHSSFDYGYMHQVLSYKCIFIADAGNYN